MHETSFTFPAADGSEISAYRWSGNDEPKAIVEIAHGMGEHAARYRRLGQSLVDAGYVVYAADQRGHGRTSPDAHGDFGPGGWQALVGDLGTLGAHARSQHPGIPLVILGHSMGSFAVQSYLLDHSADVDAAALSGTSAVDVIGPAIDPTAEVDLSGFNAAFQPSRTDYDWLSRDDEEVDKYVADPDCGFGTNPASTAGMLEAAPDLGDPERLKAIRSDLPIYLTAGEADPVGGAGQLVQLVADRYRQAGVGDVTVDVYPGARHEVFNETNRDEVVANLVAWLDRVTVR